MPLIAITREVSPNIGRCELTFHAREPIDVAKATTEHSAYRQCLESLGAQIISLPAEPDLPDSVFVEDAALVFDELAVIPIMGAKSRRTEPQTLIPTLARYRSIEYLREPATLDGGDVMVAGHRVFIGLTSRSNRHAVDQLRAILHPHGYSVEGVPVRETLHLKSACSYLANNTLLMNHRFIDSAIFKGFEILDVPESEPAAANVLTLDGTVLIPSSFPKTGELLEERGFSVRAVDVGELQKAEAGVTCCSIVFTGNERNAGQITSF